jgi:hypothetical protein
MNPLTEKIQLDTRRHFLRNCGMGLGAGALANLLSPEAFALKAPQNPLLPRQPHFSEKAKRVIYIHLPDHLHTWICGTTNLSWLSGRIRIVRMNL